MSTEKSILDRAIALAVAAHSGMRRKRVSLPYILHPMEVTVIASTLTTDEEVLAATMLHDTVEDAGITPTQIAAVCGERVARLVMSETEEAHPEMSRCDSWKVRKEESLNLLRHAEDPGTKIMWLSDKLANMRSYLRMWEAQGDAMWESFHQPSPTEQAWYYRSIAYILSDMCDTSAWKEFRQLVDRVFGGIE